MEDALEVLDQTFTIGYCKEIAKNYIQELRSEYPILLKKKVIQMFGWKRIPITFLILIAGLSIPTFYSEPWRLSSMMISIFQFFLLIESLMITFYYPKRPIKHQYRKHIDDKPTFARHQSRSLKGWGIFPGLTSILLVFSLNIFVGPVILLTLPYIYGICFLTALTTLFQIASFEVSRDRIKPIIR
jgi:hypothetical protein